MDTRLEIASRIMAGIMSRDPDIPFMAASELAVKAADDLLVYIQEYTAEGHWASADPDGEIDYEQIVITGVVDKALAEKLNLVPSEDTPRRSPAPSDDLDPPSEDSPTLRDLGVSGRACAPLERMGVETLAQLAVQSKDDIKQVRGVSVDTLKQLDFLLADHGLTWDMSADTEVEDEAEDEDDLL